MIDHSTESKDNFILDQGRTENTKEWNDARYKVSSDGSHLAS